MRLFIWAIVLLFNFSFAYVTTDGSDPNVRSVCRDGTYSTSVGRGTCSGHGGVAGSASPTPKTIAPAQQLKQENITNIVNPKQNRPIVTNGITPPQSFSKAKDLALKKIYFDTKNDLYCDCPITWQGKKGVIDIEACGYKPRKNLNRASRVEWEHVLPISIVGKQYQCWANGGRKNCQKVSDQFNRAEADLHNILPVIGEVNGDRSDYMYGMLNEKPTQYGSCQTVVDFKARKMMPKENIRGIVARITLYMYDQYGMRLSRQDQQLFDAWNKMYPATEWEKERNQRTACIMGWGNDYVSKVDLMDCNKN